MPVHADSCERVTPLFRTGGEEPPQRLHFSNPNDTAKDCRSRTERVLRALLVKRLPACLPKHSWTHTFTSWHRYRLASSVRKIYHVCEKYNLNTNCVTSASSAARIVPSTRASPRTRHLRPRHTCFPFGSRETSANKCILVTVTIPPRTTRVEPKETLRALLEKRLRACLANKNAAVHSVTLRQVDVAPRRSSVVLQNAQSR